LRGEEISLNCGGGPAALLLAAFLDPQRNVSIYEKNKTLGRKFLVAGKGGLTHSEPIAQLIERYTFPFYTGSLLDFDNQDFQKWIDLMGIPTL
jgi:predicted flavoprotein YhiN